MTYTKATFETVAAIVNRQVHAIMAPEMDIPSIALKGDDTEVSQRAMLYRIAEDFATTFERSNSAFNRARFMHACGF